MCPCRGDQSPTVEGVKEGGRNKRKLIKNKRMDKRTASRTACLTAFMTVCHTFGEAIEGASLDRVLIFLVPEAGKGKKNQAPQAGKNEDMRGES